MLKLSSGSYPSNDRSCCKLMKCKRFLRPLMVAPRAPAVSSTSSRCSLRFSSTALRSSPSRFWASARAPARERWRQGRRHPLFPDCSLIVHRCTRTHSPHPLPRPDYSFPDCVCVHCTCVPTLCTLAASSSPACPLVTRMCVHPGPGWRRYTPMTRGGWWGGSWTLQSCTWRGNTSGCESWRRLGALRFAQGMHSRALRAAALKIAAWARAGARIVVEVAVS